MYKFFIYYIMDTSTEKKLITNLQLCTYIRIKKKSVLFCINKRKSKERKENVCGCHCTQLCCITVIKLKLLLNRKKKMNVWGKCITTKSVRFRLWIFQLRWDWNLIFNGKFLQCFVFQTPADAFLTQIYVTILHRFQILPFLQHSSKLNIFLKYCQTD